MRRDSVAGNERARRKADRMNIAIPKKADRSAHTDLAQIAGSAYLAGVDPFGSGFTAGVPFSGPGPCLPIQSTFDPPHAFAAA
jgi:hypothetical protein